MKPIHTLISLSGRSFNILASRQLSVSALNFADSNYNLIKIDELNGMRKIVMNDKKTRNALSMQMMTELTSAIEKDNSHQDLRSIVISAAEGPVFSAGHNLKELTAERGILEQKSIFATCTKLMISIRNAPVPVFAVVNGLAAAAGCQLVAACDFAIATDQARFSTPGANFGVFCTTPGISVSRSVNRSVAAYMVLTGLPLTAHEALTCGLVSKVVPQDQLDTLISEIQASICAKSRPIIKLGKKFFYEQLQMPYEDALREGEKVMVKNLQYKDSQEGLKSFKEKRKPLWTHDEYEK